MNKLTRNIDQQAFVDGIARTANSTIASVFLKKKNRTPSCRPLCVSLKDTANNKQTEENGTKTYRIQKRRFP